MMDNTTDQQKTHTLNGNNHKKGNKFEAIAQGFLLKKGYLIIATNFFSKRFGEIDIIAKKDDVITFIEVKGRNSLTFGTGDTSITRSKKRKLIRSCQHWLLKFDIRNDWQIDVIVITHDFENKKYYLKHYVNCITQLDF
ncbi:MAG: YraN family protein [bacterium]